MNLSTLTPGVYTVKHPQRETPFLLSVVTVYGVTAVMGYEKEKPRPRRGKHWMPRAEVRNWIGELEEATP